MGTATSYRSAIAIPLVILFGSCGRVVSTGLPPTAQDVDVATTATDLQPGPATETLPGTVETSADAEVPAQAQDATKAASESKRPHIYNTDADAAAEIAAAVSRAKAEHKRVLVIYGGNWCSWCYKLHDAFEKNREIAGVLRNEYERVLVDVGRFDKNMEIASGYGADLKTQGVPFLTVLDSEGNVLANHDTGSLEAGQEHDVQKVRKFLGQWTAEAQDANQVLASALAQAQSESKLLLVHLGAPWCGWCGRLEDFLHANSALFAADYIPLKIDIDRMTHGKELAEKLRGSSAGGIPWIAIMDAKGEKLITSDGPKGNVGYPAEPHEIEHFIAMLKTTAKHMTQEQIEHVQSLLAEAAKKYIAR
jgi:thiol-disulfide isomerase/thioredoxin